MMMMQLPRAKRQMNAFHITLCPMATPPPPLPSPETATFQQLQDELASISDQLFALHSRQYAISRLYEVHPDNPRHQEGLERQARARATHEAKEKRKREDTERLMQQYRANRDKLYQECTDGIQHKGVGNARYYRMAYDAVTVADHLADRPLLERGCALMCLVMPDQATAWQPEKFTCHWST